MDAEDLVKLLVARVKATKHEYTEREQMLYIMGLLAQLLTQCAHDDIRVYKRLIKVIKKLN